MSWVPYSPGRRTYPELSPALQEQLANIEPSAGSGITYHPCAVVLADGSHHERVYVQDAQSYIAVWGVWPEEDSGKTSLDVASVIEIRESRERLPARFARAVYESGESGMGYTVFTLVFGDGTSQPYVSGGCVDFVSFPLGKSGLDVRSIVPHRGRDENPRHHLSYAWCLHGSGESTRRSQRWAG